MAFDDEVTRLQRQLDDADSVVEEIGVLRAHRTYPAHFLLLKERGHTAEEIKAAYDEVES